MPEQYKKFEILVSRKMELRNGEIIKGDLCFFRTMDDYEQCARKGKWKQRKEGSTWCTRPKPVEVCMKNHYHMAFMVDFELEISKVYFPFDILKQLEEE